MDKFGIFNLLNSFFSLSGQKSDGEQPSSNTADLVSNFLSSFKSKPADNNENKKNPTSSVPHPLQENMLYTINSHDALVKRVKNQETKR